MNLNQLEISTEIIYFTSPAKKNGQQTGHFIEIMLYFFNEYGNEGKYIGTSRIARVA